MVLRHARPHLEIHTRSKGHSAVAGVAYRLGLKLWDERLQVWHDYTRRALGEEVVMALTVAPDGAPQWATDPGELWNRVELAEKRKDSQVARDYRIPVPLGLDDQRAGQLAEKLARFIMSELGTPVSVGLHRDADTDALGQVKPPEKQGYHAHLYFPSRPLVVSSPAVEGTGTGMATATFGARHPMLASKALGRGMVEAFNRTWAELANDAVADAGIDARYEYQSYERLGVDLTPQPTLGAGAVALERKGFWTRKGDAVRDIVVASKAYELAHAEVVAVQQAAAVADVARERSAGDKTEAKAGHPSVPDTEQSLAHQQAPGGARTEAVQPDLVLVALAPDAPLLARFQALAPRPASPDDSERMGRLNRLVRSLQRALALLRGLADRLTDTERRASWARAAKLEAQYELDEARRHRAAATAKAEAWAKAHPVRMRAGKVLGRVPAAWRDLSHDISFHQTAVTDIKAIVAAQRSAADSVGGQSWALKQRISRARGRAEHAYRSFVEQDESLLPPLLAAMTADERSVVEPVMAEEGKRQVLVGPVIEERLVYRPPTMRPRP